MKKTKLLLMLSLFVVLMTVFGNVCAQNVQDNSLPAFRIASTVMDEKVVLSTKNFPADMNYLISMSSADDPENFTPVAKFNSKAGGSLNVTVKIPEKYQGLYAINLMLKDDNGATIVGNFINNPDAAPAEEPVEEPAEQPAEEPAEGPAEEPVEEPAEEPAEEPVEEPAEEPVEEPAEEPVEEPAEEPVEEPAEEPVEEPAEEPVEEPAEEPVEEPAEEPSEEPVEEPAEEPEQSPISLINRTTEEEPAEEPAQESITLVNEQTIEEPAAGNSDSSCSTCNKNNTGSAAVAAPITCNYSLVPYVSINSVTKNSSVTFTTNNFPANTTFSVSMGIYMPHCVPDPKDIGKPDCERPKDWVDCKPTDIPDPDAKGHIEYIFNGTQVGTLQTGDGSSQTLTFDIPASLNGANPIALWFNDLGECGFYSYNYFYNATTN